MEGVRIAHGDGGAIAVHGKLLMRCDEGQEATALGAVVLESESTRRDPKRPALRT